MKCVKKDERVIFDHCFDNCVCATINSLKTVFCFIFCKFIFLLAIFVLFSTFSFSIYANNHSSGSNGSSGSVNNENIIDSERLHLLMSKLMNEEYFHIGGVFILDNIVDTIKKLDEKMLYKPTLEIGSGHGAASNYLNKWFTKIWAIESDKKALEFSKANYPKIAFVEGENLNITKIFKEGFFSTIYMLNTASTIKDVGLLLQKLKEVTAQPGVFIIADYVHNRSDILPKITKPDGKIIYPFNTKEIEMLVKLLGMELIELKDISNEYLAYYQMLVDNIAIRKAELISCNEFSEQEITLVNNYLQKMLQFLKDGSLGGVLIFVRDIGN